jgi:hypothetical protein
MASPQSSRKYQTEKGAGVDKEVANILNCATMSTYEEQETANMKTIDHAEGGCVKEAVNW